MWLGLPFLHKDDCLSMSEAWNWSRDRCSPSWCGWRGWHWGWHCIQPPSKHHYPHLIRPGSAPAHQTCLGICSQWSGVNIVHTHSPCHWGSALGFLQNFLINFFIVCSNFSLYPVLPHFPSFSLILKFITLWFSVITHVWCQVSSISPSYSIIETQSQTIHNMI